MKRLQNIGIRKINEPIQPLTRVVRVVGEVDPEELREKIIELIPEPIP